MKISISLIVLLTLISCSNDDESATQELNRELSIQQLIGTWRITYFWDQTDRTAEFSDFLLTFTKQGEIKGSVNFLNFRGVFDLYEDTVDNDNYWILKTAYSSTETSIEMNELFVELSEEWIVKRVKNNATFIEFEERISDSRPEIMHFTKVINSNN